MKDFNSLEFIKHYAAKIKDVSGKVPVDKLELCAYLSMFGFGQDVLNEYLKNDSNRISQSNFFKHKIINLAKNGYDITDIITADDTNLAKENLNWLMSYSSVEKQNILRFIVDPEYLNLKIIDDIRQLADGGGLSDTFIKTALNINQALKAGINLEDTYKNLFEQLTSSSLADLVNKHFGSESYYSIPLPNYQLDIVGIVEDSKHITYLEIKNLNDENHIHFPVSEDSLIAKNIRSIKSGLALGTRLPEALSVHLEKDIIKYIKETSQNIGEYQDILTKRNLKYLSHEINRNF